MRDSYGENSEHAEGGSGTGREVDHTESGVTRGAELRHVLAQVSEDINGLESAMNSLPHVDNQARSECPFAEELYAQKEELERQVTEDVGRLLGYMRAIDHDIARCRNNLARIRADSAKLNRDEVRDCFSAAEEAAQRKCREALQDKDAISIVLARAEAVLKVSRTRKFPGREPQRQFPFPGPDTPVPALPGSRVTGGDISEELDGLLSIGPLEQTGSE